MKKYVEILKSNLSETSAVIARDRSFYIAVICVFMAVCSVTDTALHETSRAQHDLSLSFIIILFYAFHVWSFVRRNTLLDDRLNIKTKDLR